MKQRFVTVFVTFAIATIAATTAAAQDRPSLFGPAASIPAHQRPLFAVAPLGASAQAAAAPSPGMSDHQFGLGVRLGGFTFGLGASVRYFFKPGGPWGVQFEISRHGVDYGLSDFSSVQFAPAVIYRLKEHTFNAPLSLVPYLGGGVSIIRSSFDNDFTDFCFGDESCEEALEDLNDSASDTSTGALIFGGVELFFEKVPKLGVSGELTYNSNDDLGIASLGGPAFTVAAHWYFK